MFAWRIPWGHFSCHDNDSAHTREFSLTLSPAHAHARTLHFSLSLCWCIHMHSIWKCSKRLATFSPQTFGKRENIVNEVTAARIWKRENLCSFGEQNDLVHIIAPFVKEQLPSRLSIKWTYVFLRESSVVLNKQAIYPVNCVVYTHTYVDTKWLDRERVFWWIFAWV